MVSKRRVMPSRRGKPNGNTTTLNRDSNINIDTRVDTAIKLTKKNKENTIGIPSPSSASLYSQDTRRQSGESSDNKKNRRAGSANEEIRLAAALAIVIIVFVICWLPFCISMVLSIFLPGEIPPAFHMTTLLVGYFNSGCNPIIYGVMNKRFGKEFRQLFCSILVCKSKCSFNSKSSE